MRDGFFAMEEQKFREKLTLMDPDEIADELVSDMETGGSDPELARIMVTALRAAVRAEALEDIERLRNALEPFAKFAAKADMVTDDHIITQGSPLARRQLTMGDCKAAVRALKEKL